MAAIVLLVALLIPVGCFALALTAWGDSWEKRSFRRVEPVLLGVGLPWMGAWWFFFDYSRIEVKSGSPYGGTPTDVRTALVVLLASGVALGAAEALTLVIRRQRRRRA